MMSMAAHGDASPVYTISLPGQAGPVPIPVALHDSYRASRRTATSRIAAQLARPDTHLDLSTYESLVRNCDEFRRNNPIATAILQARASHDVGECKVEAAAGRLHPSNADGSWNARATDLFAQWAAEHADIAGQLDLPGLMRAVDRGWPIHGPMLMRVIDRTGGFGARGYGAEAYGVELIEGVRVSHSGADREYDPDKDEPGLRAGVEFDRFGRPVAFHVRDWSAAHGYLGGSPARRLAALGSIGDDGEQGTAWLINPPGQLDQGQLRAAPELAPVIIRLDMLDSAAEGGMKAYEAAAYAALYVKRREHGGLGVGEQVAQAYGGGGDDDGYGDGHGGGGAGRGAIRWEPGSVLDPGPEVEDIGQITPQFPAAALQDVMWDEIRLICAALGFSVGMAMGYWVRNYHASRSEVAVMRDRVVARQGVLINRAIIPLWRMVTLANIQAGRLEMVPGWDRCSAVLGRMPVLDEAADVQATAAAVAAGFRKPSDAVLRFTGRQDFEQFAEEYRAEARLMREAGAVPGAMPAAVTISEEAGEADGEAGRQNQSGEGQSQQDQARQDRRRPDRAGQEGGRR